MSISFSNYNITTAFEEVEGEIMNYQHEQNYMFVMVKAFNGNMLKIFEIEGNKAQLKTEIPIKD